MLWQISRKLDVGQPEKRNSNSHGARPVHQIIMMIEWIRTSRLPIKNVLSVLLKRYGGAKNTQALTLHGIHRRPFVGVSQARSWSPWLVLGAILWARIAKS